MIAQPAIANALSFDIEDWFHMVDIDAVADPKTWPGLPTLVEARTRQIVAMMDEYDVRATFFILGWIAERYPDLVREIADRGHEIATHGFWHQPVWSQTPEQFRDDVARSLEAIGRACNAAVAGYRAPTFSIVPGKEWAFDVISGLGLTYDASLFPGSRDNGGYPCPDGPHMVQGPAGGRLAELPMTLARFGPKRLAFSGGGYLRLFPAGMIRRGFDQTNAEGRPVVVYLHPRDFAPDCPRVPMPLSRRFKSYVGLAGTGAKLRMLLERYRFTTCASVLRSALGAENGAGAVQASGGAGGER